MIAMSASTMMTVNTVEIIDCEQGSEDWFAAKMGIPSASDFKRLMAGGEGKVRDEYMRKLAGEIVSGRPRKAYRNEDMERGSAMEPELRAMYAMAKDVEPRQVGFIKRTTVNGFAGYSPDSLVGSDGAVEIKSNAAHILIETMRRGAIPPEHVLQVQGGMWVANLAWIDFVAGETGMPLFIRRIRRDNAAIKRIELAVEIFNEELQAMVEWVRRWQ